MSRPAPRSLFAIVAFAVVVLVYAAVQFAAWRSIRGEAAPAILAVPIASPASAQAVVPAVATPEPTQAVVRVSATAPGLADATWRVSASRSPLMDAELVEARGGERPGEHILELPSGGEWTICAEGVAGDLRLRLARTVKATSAASELAWIVTDGAVRGRLKPEFPSDSRVKLAGRLADGTAIGATIGVAADGAFEFPFAITGRYGLAIDGRGDRRTIVTATAGQTVDAGEF